MPSLLVTIMAGDEYAEFLIVISSVFLSFQLPFALIPLVKFCGSEKIVGAMAIDPRALQRTWVIVSAIVFANIVLLCVWVHESGAVNGSPGGVFLGLFVALFMILYCAFLLLLFFLDPPPVLILIYLVVALAIAPAVVLDIVLCFLIALAFS